MKTSRIYYKAATTSIVVLAVATLTLAYGAFDYGAQNTFTRSDTQYQELQKKVIALQDVIDLQSKQASDRRSAHEVQFDQLIENISGLKQKLALSNTALAQTHKQISNSKDANEQLTDQLKQASNQRHKIEIILAATNMELSTLGEHLNQQEQQLALRVKSHELTIN